MAAFGVDVCAVFKKQSYRLYATVYCCSLESSSILAASSVIVCAILKKQLYRLYSVAFCCNLESSSIILDFSIDVCAILEKQSHCFCITLSCGMLESIYTKHVLSADFQKQRQDTIATCSLARIRQLLRLGLRYT
ncbi:hypothetical protein N7520_003213 [Penicillium odoratum]|uniref:uncharacterized protein n=1 Tax=Penicillium odoratum TaxID=1167516 RepID=UPI002547EE8D|nr:uncharacterized protein N7520_003213 [Penicillium odoratum]KAJ5772684.1 hypothetical protein N7520_003213 [Penicillium odoratum]